MNKNVCLFSCRTRLFDQLFLMRLQFEFVLRFINNLKANCLRQWTLHAFQFGQTAVYCKQLLHFII